MAEEIHPSSYVCDCGHESHFFENTIREAKAASHKREIRLGDSARNEHIIVFRRGEATCIKCPELGTLTFQRPPGNPDDREKTRRLQMTPGFEPGDRVIWLKRTPGGAYVYPVMATVLAVTAKRIKIEASEEGGRLVRYVPAESLEKRK